MFSTTRRPGGILTISIDQTSSELSCGQQLVLRQLVECFNEVGIPATWALPDAAMFQDHVLGGGGRTRHELAIRIGLLHAGAVLDRMTFAEQLQTTTREARLLGADVSTVVCPVLQVTDHLDLLVKNRISAVRDTQTVAAPRSSTLHPQSLCFGIWDVPATTLWPEGKTCWLGDGSLQFRRTLQRAIVAGEFVHLVIDARKLATGANGQLKAIGRLAKYVARRAASGDLRIETVGQLALRCTRKTRSTPAVSILRKVA